jgi:hypothetical protein
MRVGGVLSQQYRCEKCGTMAVAKNLLLFSILYGLLLVALIVAAIAVLDALLGATFRFEYLLVAVALATVASVWLFASSYWKFVLRWTKADQKG